MIDISNGTITSQTNNYQAALKSGKGNVFTAEDMIKKHFPALYKQRLEDKKHPLTFPYTVKIPKSLDKLLEGDFEPEREIVVEKPFEGQYGPMWFGDATEGVKLRFGYVDGDSRYLTEFALDDTNIHGIMAGTSGSGKSVALNTIIYGMCYEYAPWEINLTLSDAKIVEFKSLAKNNPMPHIHIVAACTDPDYLISVLLYKVAEMKKMNSVFTLAQAKNIKEFRQKTGLCLPQNIMIFDEFQTMFSNAGKKLPKVLDALQAFAKLGRNTGYHIYLTSQEMGSEIPNETLASISLRGALGCDARVSEQIIGNDAAKVNKGKKGKLIINDQADLHNKSDNTNIAVPWTRDQDTTVLAHDTIEFGHKMDVTPVMRFYDEEEVIRERDYPSLIGQFPATPNRMYLGTPSFLMNDPEQIVRIEFSGTDVDNICVLSKTMDGVKRIATMMLYNAMRMPQVKNCIICPDAEIRKAVDLSSFNPLIDSDDRAYEGSTFFASMRSLLNRRQLILDMDKEAQRGMKHTEQTDALFDKCIPANSEFNNELNKVRFYYFHALLNEPTWQAKFPANSDDAKIETFKKLLGIIKAAGGLTKFITKDDFQTYHFWIFGADKILGLGRDAKQKMISEFKKTLQDMFLVNMRCIMFTRNFEEFMELKAAFRFYIFEQPDPADVRRTKCEDYPEAVLPALGVLYDQFSSGETIMKFKKMFFNDEIVA